MSRMSCSFHAFHHIERPPLRSRVQCVCFSFAHWRWQPNAPMAISTPLHFSCSRPLSMLFSQLPSIIARHPQTDPSSSPSRLLTTTSHVQSSRFLTSDVALSLSSCPSDYYILVSQQGVSVTDYSKSKKSTPLLAKALSPSQAHSSGIRSSLSVPDVLGPLDTSTWMEVLTSKCGVSVTTIDASKQSGIPTKDLNTAPLLIKLNLPAPSGTHTLSGNDAFLASLLDLLPKQNYTVLYTTTRSEDGMLVAQGLDRTESIEYDMESEIQESMHWDLKRDLGLHESAAKRADNQTMIDGPLFDKYQFFTPGKMISTPVLHLPTQD